MAVNLKITLFFCFGFLLFFISCQQEEEGVRFNYLDLIPSHFPTPIPNPDSIPNALQLALGKELFFDPVLSRDSSLSCASCHKPGLAFADTVRISPGIENRLGMRNSPSIANVVYQKRLLKEGGLPTLEMQVLVPIQEHAEFDFNIVEISKRLEKMPKYVEMSQSAYQRPPDPYVISRSIAAFERAIFSGNSTYDQYLRGGMRLTPLEVKGMELFNSEKTKCSACHAGILFTNQDIVNNGLYAEYTDRGQGRLTGNIDDDGKFKIPSLRNVVLTFPYMHDGSLKTLENVIEHYNSGGKKHKNQHEFIRPLNLTIEEKQALIAFLNTLTDEHFINNKLYIHE